MPQITIYLDDAENDIVEKVKKELKCSKHAAIKKMIRTFKPGVGGK